MPARARVRTVRAAPRKKSKTVLIKIMANEVIWKGKTIITGEQAARGYRLLATSPDFAFVRAANPDAVLAIPVRKELKDGAPRFEALDFLKFREGVIKIGEPWRYLMVINGLERISVPSHREWIHFNKMTEVAWKELLPQLKETLEYNKHRLLNTVGTFETACPHCGQTLRFEHQEQNWTRDGETEMLYFTTVCPADGKAVEIICEDGTDLYYAAAAAAASNG